MRIGECRRILPVLAVTLCSLVWVVCDSGTGPRDPAGDGGVRPACTETGAALCACGDTSDDVNYTVLYPNGGETLTAGTIDTIRYCVEDSAFLDSYCLDGMVFELSIDNGKSWTNVSPLSNEAGVVSWFVPVQIQAAGGPVSAYSLDCRIRVTTYGDCGDPLADFDISNSAFTIRQ